MDDSADFVVPFMSESPAQADSSAAAPDEVSVKAETTAKRRKKVAAAAAPEPKRVAKTVAARPAKTAPATAKINPHNQLFVCVDHSVLKDNACSTIVCAETIDEARALLRTALKGGYFSVRPIDLALPRVYWLHRDEFFGFIDTAAVQRSSELPDLEVFVVTNNINIMPYGLSLIVVASDLKTAEHMFYDCFANVAARRSTPSPHDSALEFQVKRIGLHETGVFQLANFVTPPAPLASSEIEDNIKHQLVAVDHAPESRSVDDDECDATTDFNGNFNGGGGGGFVGGRIQNEDEETLV